MSELHATVFDDEQSMGREAASWISERIRKNPKQLLCIAAGYTSRVLMNELSNRCRKGTVDFNDCSFVAMDEWTGMNSDTNGSCGWFLQENFLSKVNIQRDNVFLWNGKTVDTDSECRRANEFIREHSENHRIDILILGLGMNGHLALNEPGTPLDCPAHLVKVDQITAAVGQKYFKKDTVITGGLTLGLADFMMAKETILLVSSQNKRDILSRILNAGGFRPELPATALYVFDHAKVFCDKAALLT